MEEKMDITDIIFKIKSEIPKFKKEDFMEYAKWTVPQLYSSLKNEKEIDIKCSNELVETLIKNKTLYRIKKEIDYISIQYTELIDFKKEENNIYVKVYMSIYFKDDVSNNIINIDDRDRFWNDIWIVTYKKDLSYKDIDAKCNNCGAIMEYNSIDEILKCDYCGNIKICNDSQNWKIVDIEVNH